LMTGRRHFPGFVFTTPVDVMCQQVFVL